MATKHKQWDLFAQQPIVLFHPALLDLLDGGKVFLAGATRYTRNGGGVMLWNADYIISSNIPGGMPGTGFPNNPIDGAELKFIGKTGMWHLYTQKEPKWIYRLALPNEEDMRMWENWKQYVPNLKKLQEMTGA